MLQVRIKTTHGTEKVLAYDGNEIYLNPRVAFSGTRGDAEPLRHLFKDAGSNNLPQISGQARPPNSFQGTLPWTSFKPNKTTPRKDNRSKCKRLRMRRESAKTANGKPTAEGCPTIGA